eukprot:676360-Pyramimonas_sp.AAC.1
MRGEQKVLVARGAREQRVELQPPVVVLLLAVPDLVAASSQDHAWATPAEGATRRTADGPGRESTGPRD